MDPLEAAMVCGVVELNSRLRPVSETLLVSSTVAVRAWLLLSEMVMAPFTGVTFTGVSTMEAGGQVEKKPALEAEAELATVAVTSTEPG